MPTLRLFRLMRTPGAIENTRLNRTPADGAHEAQQTAHREAPVRNAVTVQLSSLRYLMPGSGVKLIAS